MNIILNGCTYELIKTDDTENFIEYKVLKNDTHIGYINKYGAEVHYTGRDTAGEVKATAATLRDTLEGMVLNMFYSLSYRGERHIKTLGAWTEGATVKVEYVKNDYVKHAERVVRYSKAAGDLYITLDNNKYFYYEFK